MLLIAHVCCLVKSPYYIDYCYFHQLSDRFLFSFPGASPGSIFLVLSVRRENHCDPLLEKQRGEFPKKGGLN